MRSTLSLLAAAAAIFACASVHAEVYKWVDKNGRIHYSDSLPDGARVIAIQDRLSLYSPDPALTQVSQGSPPSRPSATFSDRIASLERQLQSERERLARSLATGTDARAAYERCLADRRIDCSELLPAAP